MRKLLTETLHKVKTTHSSFSSWMGVFLSETADWWAKDFRCSVMRTQIQLASSVMVPAWGRMMGSAASGGRGKYCMVGEHTHPHCNFVFQVTFTVTGHLPITGTSFLWICLLALLMLSLGLKVKIYDTLADVWILTSLPVCINIIPDYMAPNPEDSNLHSHCHKDQDGGSITLNLILDKQDVRI
jgi:hypothetical protein